MLDLDELERLEREATPGPWEVGYYSTQHKSDAPLIALTRNHLSELIRLARIGKEVEESKQ